MRRRRGTAIVGLLALLVVDAVLVFLAMRPSDPPGDAIATTSPSEISTPPAENRSAPSLSPTPTASPTSESAARQLVSAGEGGAAVRAEAGTCDGGGAALEITTDGADWRPVELEVTSLLRVRSVDADNAWVVGTDDACTPRFLRTSDGGETWQVEQSTGGAWHLLPSGVQRLHAPDGNVDSPCKRSAPVDLASVGPRRAALLCPTARVQVTTNGGDTWTRAGTAPGAQALTYVNKDTAYAAAPAFGDCEGVAVIASDDGGETWRERGCADATGDAVALAFSTSDDGLLATTDALLSTGDGGRTWQEV
ncbi:MAG: WD40/YVTN/BNR-like repeat-containing protein [Nocardioidaceae bacterium]